MSVWPQLRERPADPPPRPAATGRKIVDGGFWVLIGFTLAGGVAVALRDGWDRVAAIALETFGFIVALSPKVIGGIFIAATLPLILPRDRMARWIGHESGPRGLLLASVAGTVIPGGPEMTFTLAAGFAGLGADIGALVAYVTGWSLLGLNRTLIWELSFLPPELVGLRYVLCLPMPFLAGWAARRLFGGRK